MKKSECKKTIRILTNNPQASIKERKLEEAEERQLSALAIEASNQAIGRAQEKGLYITYIEDQKIKVVSPSNEIKVVGKLKTLASSLTLRKGMKLERK